jgi:diadenosine tetraphosphatase ApaH/serine/threonine PP2A family protein phosphatase
VHLVGSSDRWTAASLFALLTSPRAEEWRDRVGVVGAADGSAKPTTRLLAADGWVCKTRVDAACETEAAARRRALVSRAAGLGDGVWHPDKDWAVVRAGGAWFPLTICRRLETLRQLPRLEDRMLAWIDMIQTSVDAHRASGLGLDVNPANFGVERRGGRLYYLDDEFYDGFGERNVAGAVAARIPEEEGATPEAWRAWGERLCARVALGELTWTAVGEELRLYPLAERFEEKRAAVLGAIEEHEARGRRARRATPAMTCVLADVHANRPALEAVLADARARGADSFLFLGDAIGYGPHPAECVRLLADLPRAVYVRGNHDHAIATGRLDCGMNRLARRSAEWTRAALDATELAWLAELPVDHAEDGWMAVHGAPQDPRRFLAYVYDLTYEDNLRYLRAHDIPACFYGHTHVQLSHVERAAGPAKRPGPGTLKLHPKQPSLVNPGSVGQPRDGDPRAAYALWDRRTGDVATLRVAYDIERTIADLHAAALPAELEARLRAGN